MGKHKSIVTFQSIFGSLSLSLAVSFSLIPSGNYYLVASIFIFFLSFHSFFASPLLYLFRTLHLVPFGSNYPFNIPPRLTLTHSSLSLALSAFFLLFDRQLRCCVLLFAPNANKMRDLISQITQSIECICLQNMYTFESTGRGPV